MAYVPLRVDPTTPSPVREFLAEHVDMQFHDVHCMLRLPMKAQQVDAGCNLAAAAFLLSLVAGLSTALYQRSGRDGGRFKGVLEHYYPWDQEPHDAIRSPTLGAAQLYDVFRNPLVHALGLDTKQVKVGRMKQVVLWHDKRRARLAIAKGNGLRERALVALECAITRPSGARGTILRGTRKRTLLVPGLYWGTREMVMRLTQDAAVMADAARFLERWRDAV